MDFLTKKRFDGNRTPASADAERLVESLGRLYRSLRDAVPPIPSNSTEGDAP